MDSSSPHLRQVMLALIVSIMAAVQYAHSQRVRPGDTAALVVAPIGEVDRRLAVAVARGVAEAYGLTPCVATTSAPLPRTAFHPVRCQYLAETLRNQVRPGNHEPGVVVLGLTEADLYAPGLNYVLGEADMPGNTAIVSLAYLRPTTPGATISRSHLQERAVKVAIHEVGHLFGLVHCREAGCVMQFANSAAMVDAAPRKLCPACQNELR